MHNLVLAYLNIWDPNPRMEDMQLMELASSMVNEESRAQEVRRVIRRENMLPIHIRLELFNSRGVINNHLKIEKDDALAEKYLSTQAQAMAHFDDVYRLFGDEWIMDSQRNWNILPHSLRNLEYHTP